MVTISSTKHSLLVQNVSPFAKLTIEEVELIISSFKVIEAKKGDVIIRQGSIVNRLYFINSGYMRSFYLNEEGQEFTTSLAGIGQMMSAFEGFQKGLKASESIQAISDCELLVVAKSDYDWLFRAIKAWPKFCSGVYESAILSSGERLLDMQRLNASQRYEKLVSSRPELAMNVPVKYLASYLGIQPQSLSRIRAQRK